MARDMTAGWRFMGNRGRQHFFAPSVHAICKVSLCDRWTLVGDGWPMSDKPLGDIQKCKSCEARSLARSTGTSTSPSEPQQPQIDPRGYVHVVPVGQPKARVYQALCGEDIHKTELHIRATGEPTCPTCRRLSR